MTVFQENYQMQSRPRGYAVIINMKDFRHRPESRAGSELDVARLCALFHQMHFEVKLYTDLEKRVGLDYKIALQH